MMFSPRHRLSALPPIGCLVLFLLFSCGSRAKVAGSYIKEPGQSTVKVESQIELKEDGGGVWKVGDQEFRFSWDLHGSEIRMYTKSGGVIVGKVKADVITLNLPGGRVLSFKKVS
jgi:hypothetical protein